MWMRASAIDFLHMFESQVIVGTFDLIYTEFRDLTQFSIFCAPYFYFVRLAGTRHLSLNSNFNISET
ncbi:MAG: hypothetical protein C5S49_01125 [Candidatus Methanogaster sp.]|nr:MAG: hypothetical protein C5S49_01125 [ANME-2 cluster archaeon]